ncbi:hypothetical protein SAMN05421767_10171 [Granulicatella balaenopterae]|uniref:Uncharacterized protein n=1 Tax=Granulicatella balaenopterae TaxID=137733 RepID=A0A1H9GWN6_9LACT|nr:hypothetical protein [Granulicatella balaenopterae]SEQ54457.1 hypothetical protein SAMN05421767_10171 [Granulicatella balaenopterae]
MKNMKKLAMLILAGMTIGATTVQAEEVTQENEITTGEKAPPLNMDIRFFGKHIEGKTPDKFIQRPFIKGKEIKIHIEQVSEANSMTEGEEAYLAPNEKEKGVFEKLVGFGDGWTNNTTNTKTIIINNNSKWETVTNKADHTAAQSGTYIADDDLLWRSSVSPLEVAEKEAKAGIYVFKVSQELPSFDYHTDGKELTAYKHAENGFDHFNWGSTKYYHVYVKNNGEVTYTVTTDIKDKYKIYKIPSDDVRFVNTYFSKSEPMDITVTGKNDNFAEYTLKMNLTNAILKQNSEKGMKDQAVRNSITGSIQREGEEPRTIEFELDKDCYVNGLISGDKVIFEGLPAGTQVKVTEDRVMNAIEKIQWTVFENGENIAASIRPEDKITMQQVVLAENKEINEKINSMTIHNIFGEIKINGILTGRNPMILVMTIIAGAVFFYIFMQRREEKREAE